MNRNTCKDKYINTFESTKHLSKKLLFEAQGRELIRQRPLIEETALNRLHIRGGCLFLSNYTDIMPQRKYDKK